MAFAAASLSSSEGGARKDATEQIQLQIIETTKFLSDFDSSLRRKMSSLAERVSVLENAVASMEESIGGNRAYRTENR